MEEKRYPVRVSDREAREWIPGCPMQVKRTRVEIPAEGACPTVTVVTAKCTEADYTACTVRLTLMDSRREVIATMDDIAVTSGESAPIDTSDARVVYASAMLLTVTGVAGTWENTENSTGVRLPEQDLFWQTDPLYPQIKRECAGVVEAKYKPDTLVDYNGAWRCACGQVNLADSAACGACGCAHDWLDSHLEPGYLAAQKAIADSKTEKELVREQKRKARQPSDKTKAILILAALVVGIVLVVLTFTTFIPSIRYASAISKAEAGEYDEAIAIFADLGSFRDAAAQREMTNYRKAQFLTGLDEVHMTTSAQSPWYSIDENGMLSFNKDKYEDGGGSWENITVPDMVDNTIVRSLERNFFINCKELVSVTLSDCIEEIGEQTFLNCEGLTSVEFGKNITVIGPRTFIDCHALEEITIPDTVTTLGARAFNNCVSLQKVVLGQGITQIGDYLFSQCGSLTQVTLSSPVTRIGDFAFFECGKLTHIFCRFEEAEWGEPTIGSDNEAFTAIELSFGN